MSISISQFRYFREFISISVFLLFSNFLFSQSLPDKTANEIKEHLNVYEYLILEKNQQQAGLRLAKVATLYWENAFYDSAVTYFNKTADIFARLDGINEQKSIYTNIGAIYSEQRKHKKAIEYFNKSLELAIQVGNEKEIAIKRIDLANSYSLNKQKTKAIKLINQSMKYAQGTNNQSMILSLYSQYVNIYKQNGDKWKAREYEIRYNHRDDSIEGVNYNLNTKLNKERRKFVEDSLANIVHVSSDIVEEKKTEDQKRDAGMSREDFVKSRKLSALQTLDTSVSIKKEIKKEPADSVYTEVDILPEFPGGEFGLKIFLANALTLTSEYLKQEDDSIIIKHIINKYGFVSKASIIKGIHPALDAEVIKVMRKMPAWIPAKQDNKNVSFLTQTVIPYPVKDMQQIIDGELTKLSSMKNYILESNNNDTIQDFYVKIGNLHFYLKEYEKALDYYNKALVILREENNQYDVSNLLSNIGTIYHSWLRYNTAIDYYLQSYELKTEIEDKKGAGKALYSIGQVYIDMTDTTKALEYFERSMEIDSLLGNKQDQAVALNNIGIIYFSQHQLEKAYQYYNKALAMYGAMNNKFGSSTTMNNIGNVQVEMKDFDNAINTYEQSVSLKEEIQYYEGIAISLYNIGNVYLFTDDYDNAIEYYNMSIGLSKKYYLNEVEYKNYESLAEIFAKQDDCANTLKYHKLYTKVRFYLNEIDKITQISEQQVKYIFQEKVSTELIQKINELQIANSLKDKRINKYFEELREQKLITKLESERNVQQIALLNKEKLLNEKDLASKRLQRNALIVFLIFVIGILLIIYNNYRQKKSLNKLLFKQKNLLEKTNAEITDSIQYAQYIQSAILPRNELRDELLKEHFIFFKPRDIVSGDFYWMTKIDKEVIVAAADCTGHGVPGAFMSMLGISFLNEIVNKEYITHTGVILRRLRKEVINALQQTGEEGQQRDGMDLALCSINFEEKKMQFSGANNPLYIIRKKGSEPIANSKIIENDTHCLYEIKGDKMPISFYERMDKYTLHEINLLPRDCIYMSSDGYADQFSESGKKFKYKPFKDLLLNNADKPMSEQSEILKTTIEKWQGNFEQIDDILVMGIRIS